MAPSSPEWGEDTGGSGSKRVIRVNAESRITKVESSEVVGMSEMSTQQSLTPSMFLTKIQTYLS